MPQLTIISFILLLSLLASAQSNADSAAIASQLQASRQLYTDGKVDSAIAVATAAAQLARQAGIDEGYGSAQIYLGNFHYATGRLGSALVHYTITARLASASPSDRFTSYMNSGIIYDYLGKIDSALYYYNQSIEYAEQANLPRLKASGLLNFGSFYDDRGNYQRALEYYNQAVKLLEEHGPSDKLNIAKTNIGGIYEELDRTTEAIKLYKEVLASADVNSKLLRSTAYLQLAEAYLTLDSLQLANTATLRLFEVLESFEDVTVNIDAHYIKGRIEMEHERYRSAIDYFKNALQIAEDAGLQTRMVSANLQLATAYYELGNLPLAEEFAQKGLQLSLKNSEFDKVTRISLLLSEINQSLGNITIANEYLNQYIRYEDSLDAQNSRKEVNRLLLEHREYEYQLLKKEQELQDLRLKSQEAQLTRNRSFLAGTGVVSLILLLLLTWLYRSRIKEKRLNALLEKNNRKIEEQNKMLRKLNTDKDRLLHVVAHDLRNPMNAINGFIQLLEEEDNLTDDQRQNIAMIKKSIVHGTDIIDELLRMETEQPTKLNKTDFNITELVNDVVKEFEGMAKEKSIDIRFTDHDNLHIHNDAGKIKRITENLLSNAIKFSPRNETVAIGLRQDGDYITINVSDNGPGFSKQDKQLLFKKFQKLSAQPTAGEGSTGIGLAIVHDFVTLMDGKISVESNNGNGTTMTVMLPAELTSS